MTPKFKLDLYFMMLGPSVNEIDASLQELSIRNKKCDKADMIPLCRSCFAGNTKMRSEILTPIQLLPPIVTLIALQFVAFASNRVLRFSKLSRLTIWSPY